MIADLKVPSEHIKGGKYKEGRYRLRKLHGNRNIVIFFAEGCHICDAEKAAARELAASDRKVRVLLVNVDSIVASDPSLADKLFNAFDLSTLPFIIETDRKGNILRRYVTLQ